MLNDFTIGRFNIKWQILNSEYEWEDYKDPIGFNCMLISNYRQNSTGMSKEDGLDLLLHAITGGCCVAPFGVLIGLSSNLDNWH